MSTQLPWIIGEAEENPLPLVPYAALAGILATLEGRMELMQCYIDIHVPDMTDAEFHGYLVSCVDLNMSPHGLEEGAVVVSAELQSQGGAL